MLGHLSAIATGLVGLPFLGPLVVFLVLEGRSGPVRGHSADALTMAITFTTVEAVLSLQVALLTLATWGVGALFAWVPWGLAIAFVVVTVRAAVAAHHGRVHRHQLVFRIVR